MPEVVERPQQRGRSSAERRVRAEHRLRRRAACADREREHALLAVAVVGDDAPADGVVPVGEIRCAAASVSTCPCADGLRRRARTTRVALATAALPRATRTVSSKTTRTLRGALSSTAPFAGMVRDSVACADAAAGKASATSATSSGEALHGGAGVPEPGASLAAPDADLRVQVPERAPLRGLPRHDRGRPDGVRPCAARVRCRSSSTRSRSTTRARASTRRTTAGSRSSLPRTAAAATPRAASSGGDSSGGDSGGSGGDKGTSTGTSDSKKAAEA